MERDKAFLYGQSYADRFCSLETFKRHLIAMGFMEGDENAKGDEIQQRIL